MTIPLQLKGVQAEPVQVLRIKSFVLGGLNLEDLDDQLNDEEKKQPCAKPGACFLYESCFDFHGSQF